MGIYNCDNFPYQKFINEYKKKKKYKIRKQSYKVIDTVNSFDIETTSLIYNDEKIGFMYLWGFSFNNDYIVVGRRWEEFLLFAEKISNLLERNSYKIVVYIHNASFEFAFMYHFLKKLDPNMRYFATDKSKILYFETRNIIFKCSYRLTNLSLRNATKKYQTSTSKLNDNDNDLDLDYSIIRTPKTKLTKREKQYFINDLITVVEVVQKILEIYGDTINNIPMTSTGFVRRMVRKSCNNYYYRKKFSNYELPLEIFKMCQANKKGGDTHANRFQFGVVHEDIDSYDIKSSYPYQMLVKYFPISSFKFVDNFNEMFEYYLNHKCCLFYIQIGKITIKRFNEMTILSRSHILNEKTCKVEISDNGRVVSATNCILCLNELDYLNLLRYYDLENVKILKGAIANRGRLPKEIRKVIFEIFKQKCDLEEYKGTELEFLYSNKKAELNAIYGMMLTSLIHNEYKIIYDEENGFIWEEKEKTDKEIDKELLEYFDSFSHFLYYPWGLWVVSHSRTDLYDLIDCCNFHLYHDTDSCKGKKWDMKKLKAFNEKRKQICIDNKIDYKDIYLGTCEHDGHYEKFISYGAKKYIYESKGKINITIAGCNKKCANQLKDINDVYEGRIFKDATNQAVYSMTPPHYIKVNNDTIWTGGGVYICKGDYTLELCDDYLNKAIFTNFEEGFII